MMTLANREPRLMMEGVLQDLSPGVPLTDGIVFGVSERMRAIKNKLKAIANSKVPVLIMGESGTGKDLIANIVHNLSPVCRGRFVRISCPAVPGPLFESELFGYEKGSFTGAHKQKIGRVELADGGTLFLDEIGDLSGDMQAKLLQVLQEGKFSAIGSSTDKKVELRVVCATNRRLECEIENKNFREDLFYRISVITITLPSLRERAVDIPALANYFVACYNERFNCRVGPISQRLMNEMERYHWPGNIRQLENVIKRYVVLGSEQEIAREMTPKQHFFSAPDMDFDDSLPLKKITKQVLREVERQIISKTLHRNNWNRREAAKALHISYRALLYKVKDAGIGVPCKFERSESDQACSVGV